jgi:hypothetical protein
MPYTSLSELEEQARRPKIATMERSRQLKYAGTPTNPDFLPRLEWAGRTAFAVTMVCIMTLVPGQH